MCSRDAAALRLADDVAEAAGLAAELHELGQHDVAEGEAEQQAQRVEDAGHARAARAP